jgi:Putative auto-transporter adhesin, head GIN domain
MSSRIFTSPVILALAALLILAACGVRGSGNVISEARTVSGFNELVVIVSGQLMIQQGDTETLTIEAEDNILPLLISAASGNRLTLASKPGSSYTETKPIIYHLTVKNLNLISLNGSSSAQMASLTTGALRLEVTGSGSIKLVTVKSDRLNLQLSGSGNIEIAALTTPTVIANLNGSGSARLSGSADSQSIAGAGSINYNAEKLDSKTVKIDVSGSASVVVKASETLDVKANGSASITYFGDPKLTQSLNGSVALKRG